MRKEGRKGKRTVPVERGGKNDGGFQQEGEDNLHELVLVVSLEDFAELFEYLWCEEVGSSVDDVAYKRFRLFNVMQHLWCVGVGGCVGVGDM